MTSPEMTTFSRMGTGISPRQSLIDGAVVCTARRWVIVHHENRRDWHPTYQASIRSHLVYYV